MKMTNALTTFTLLTTLCFSSLVKSDDVVVPVVAKPSILQEGTQRELTAGQIAELLPWAKNSKVFLNDLLSSVQGLTSVDKLERFEDGIKSIVGESAPKNSELLMRYILNRALVVNDLLKSEMNADEVGTIDTKLRVLTLSIKMAITYYDTDMDTLNKKTTAPFIEFGIQYFNFLSELNKSIFDASASYNIQRTALEWLQWDLYRDLNNQQMASQIVKINNSLKIYPVKRMSDTQYISGIRQMKLLSQSLDLNNFSTKKVSSNNDYSRNDSDSDSDSSSNNNSPKDGAANQANLISQCGSSFSDAAYRSSCVADGIAYNLDVKLIQLCGNTLSTNSSRYDCLTNIRGKTATMYNVKAYKNCGSSFSDNAYRLVCMEAYNTYSMPTEDIAACGADLSTNDSRYSCLIEVGKQKKQGNSVRTINACGSALSDNAYRISCITNAVTTQITDDEISVCGSSLSTNDSRLGCMYTLSKNRNTNSKSIVKACGSAMSDNAYRNACIDTATSKNTNSSNINACGAMGTNDARMSCLYGL
ncbi:hypothetical protein SHI21_11885 [Bacteriovorax sp. PP10]|uniref:Uncharacterized protein n=1 Tax=Bacteriovorax antarcticus TaxID=3088717 RepID=A0ABU5VV43_9BACT|nr:hypothetical protein [Bacteriovorax sp. PP10]MEA9356914.1 hypothetical protein [Bacteriovorax sp. PP10]